MWGQATYFLSRYLIRHDRNPCHRSTTADLPCTAWRQDLSTKGHNAGEASQNKLGKSRVIPASDLSGWCVCRAFRRFAPVPQRDGAKERRAGPADPEPGAANCWASWNLSTTGHSIRRSCDSPDNGESPSGRICRPPAFRSLRRTGCRPDAGTVGKTRQRRIVWAGRGAGVPVRTAWFVGQIDDRVPARLASRMPRLCTCCPVISRRQFGGRICPSIFRSYRLHSALLWLFSRVLPPLI